VTSGSFPRTSLSTERLDLRPFETADAADVHAVWNDETYLRFAPVGLPTAGADLETAVEWCTTGVEAQRRAGTAAEAARTAATWALTELGFARVTLAAAVDNVASQRVARAAGFQFEGILRNAALTRAGRGDSAIYSLVPRDLAVVLPAQP
jgi:ribosomal-protein-alanine N-acetyltransferase